MKLFDIFKKKKEVKEESVEEVKPEVEVKIDEEQIRKDLLGETTETEENVEEVEAPKTIKVRCIRTVTLVKEETKINNGKIYDLNITQDRAKELEEKGFIKIIGE